MKNALPRKFQYDNGTETLILDDINADLPASSIKELYANQFPELLNANIIDKGYQDNCLLFEFETIAGTKG